ncbi:ABC transporter transmembrane domain-containing protein [Saccharibacillus sacchari]|uniref:ABC transporter transmembrane domain-containing protein n=1 Tax=Saccharibacillus sacchari TaxID=456493 RepID=UPI0004AE3676|nr:ABC transporter ATP-binding protein [Saccharibacillus sacchari]
MKRWETYRALTREIGGVRKPLIVLGLLKGWNLICGLVPLILYARLVDHVLVGGDLSELGWIVAGYAGVFLLATVGIIIGKSFSNRLHFTFDVKVKRKLLTRYAALDRDTYRKYGIGDVKSRVESDTEAAGNFFATHLLEFGYSVVYAIALVGILLVYDWRIALISFVFVPISLITVNALGRKTQKYGEELWRLQTGYESFLHTNFQNWKDVKTNNLEADRLDELNDHYKKIRRFWFMNQLYLHLGITYSFFTKNFITQLFVYFIGGLFVIQGYAEVGVLLIFVSYYGQFFGFIEGIGNSVMNFRND